MNKMKILLVLLCVALLCAACGKDPVADPTTDPTGASEQLQATEEATEVNLPGVEENVFEEEEIQIPTTPVGVTNTGTGNQGSTGNQGTTGNQGSTGNQGTTGNQGSTGNQGTTGNQGSTGNQGGTANDPTEPMPSIDEATYEDYNNMTPDQQVEFFNQFPSMEAFVKWYNEAKAAYDKENGAIEIGGDGSVDLGDIVDP